MPGRWVVVRIAVRIDCICNPLKRATLRYVPLMAKWFWVIRACVVGLAADLFPPQARDWSLATTAPLSPKAHRRLAREAATQPFAKAAQALNEDWHSTYDGKQIQRWAQAAGEQLLDDQTVERQAYQRGGRPQGPRNDPQLLVIGMDGGRVQNREKNSENGSRWREDKVLTISSYLPGDGQDKDPKALVTTYLATMKTSDDFGVLARLEAERRGIRQARQVIVLGDGAAWIDTLHQRHFHRHVRIIDWYHAAEHLYDVAKAAHPEHADAQQPLAQRLTDALWNGHVQSVILAIEALTHRAGPPRANDPADHPRRVLHQNLGYFQRHGQHMNYPQYRQRGWPIGSGMTEAGVKQFNKRVKGTEQFWYNQGVEPILALRSLWLSNDDRWNHHWRYHKPLRTAA